jgi:hypothetical protein
MVFGLALLLSTPFILKVDDSIVRLQTGSNAVELQNSVQKLESSIETVAAAGEPARRTFYVNLPKSVESGQIVNNSVIYTIRTPSGQSQLVKTFDTNITGNLPQTPGRHRLTVYVDSGEVVIEVVS